MTTIPAAGSVSEVTPDLDPVIQGRARDLGGFGVRRVLPHAVHRMVGPFIFFDHAGPAEFARGQGMDVRPHPHIGLATVTYLFEGEIMHRDSLGTEQPVRPGDVNWMVAGRGIVHSERTPADVRARGSRMHGIQCWVALPTSEQERPPSFEHHPQRSLPVVRWPGVEARLIAGTAYGEEAPTGVLSPTLYVHARVEGGAMLPVDDGHHDRAVYVAKGEIEVGERRCVEGDMILLSPGAHVSVRARSSADIMLLGGAPLEGHRHIYWNLVSSSPELIERAKADWREGRFPKVPGDEVEFIPLPET